MTVRSVSLLVLDAQGVVFNAPFLWFLEQAAAELARDPEGMLALWRDELRIPTWTGAISEAEFWRRLTGSNGRADQYRKQLATMYELGPAAGRLAHWNSVAPIWLLSNHRSEWLLPRLDQFDLTQRFERILVSDQLGCAKPDQQVFAPVLDHAADAGSVLFVDDQKPNVQAAQRLGMQTILAQGEGWLAEIDAALTIV